MALPAARRQQLTLFVQEPWRSRLADLRSVLDPVQSALIAAHVTLCREDELDGLDPASIAATLASWPGGPLTLGFGPPRRFEGHGVLLPCIQGAEPFGQLRQWLLQRRDVRPHAAHLTLAHPRNPVSAGNTEEALRRCPPALQLELPSVALIEQQGSSRWQLLAEWPLGDRGSRALR